MGTAICRSPSFTIGPEKGSFRFERLFDFFLCRPPIWSLNLGHPLPDERFWGVDIVEFARVFSQEFLLIGLRQIAFAHRLKRPPDIVAVMVIHIRGPG